MQPAVVAARGTGRPGASRSQGGADGLSAARARKGQRPPYGVVVVVVALAGGHLRGAQANLFSRGLSVRYVKNILAGSFRAMIRQATADGFVTQDPFAGLKWPKPRTPEPDPYTPDERTRIIRWFAEKEFSFKTGRATEPAASAASCISCVRVCPLLDRSATFGSCWPPMARPGPRPWSSARTPLALLVGVRGSED